VLPRQARIVVYCAHGHEVSQGVARALREQGLDCRYLEQGIEGWRQAGGRLYRKPVGAATGWVTRARPKIDRIACPWLIARFIDRDARFLYVPADQVMRVAADQGAIAFDVKDVELGHHGEHCSFDALLAAHRLTDAALQRLAPIVRAADTGNPQAAPEAAGLLAISQGLSQNYPDDHAMLEHGWWSTTRSMPLVAEGVAGRRGFSSACSRKVGASVAAVAGIP